MADLSAKSIELASQQSDASSIQRDIEDPPSHLVAEVKQGKRTRRCAMCCGICGAITLVLVIVIVILAFTVFKSKDPQVTVDSITLKSLSTDLQFTPSPKVSVNLTLGLVVSVKNPNKVSFKYTNSTSYLWYRGEEVGFVPIPAGELGSGGTEQISSYLELLADRLLTNSNLVEDFLSNSLPFSTTSDISGRIDVLHIFKHHVYSSSNCTFSVSILSQSVSDTVCNYKVRL